MAVLGNVQLTFPDTGSVYDLCMTPISTKEHDITEEYGQRELVFLSLVLLEKIPLHIIAGPNSRISCTLSAEQALIQMLREANDDVSTNGDAHESWPAGLLCKIRSGGNNIYKQTENPITELLIYLERDYTRQTPALRLFALPLSSHLLYKDLTRQIEESQPKARLGALFDEAAERRHKAKRRGGASISLAASKGNAQSQRIIPRIKAEEVEDDVKVGTTLANPRVLEGRHGGKSPPQTMMNKASRPASRGFPEQQQQRKRSSSLQMAIADDVYESSFAERNKKTVAKTVMACMRMYGLQQRKTEGQPRVEDESQLESLGTSDDDEYKGVYHQTYKGAVFTFRRQIDTELLRPDAVRDVVDKLLGVFCHENG